MKSNLGSIIDNVTSGLFLVVVALLPVFFFTQTTEFFNIPKLILLVVATVILLGLWFFSWIAKGQITVTRTPLDIPFLFLLVVVVASTYFSPTRYPAIYGNFPNVHGSAISWVAYILLYFVAASHLKTTGAIKNLLYVLYASALVNAVVSFFSFFGMYLPFDFAKTANFTLTGSSFSAQAMFLMLLPLPLISILHPNKFMSRSVGLIVASIFSVIIAITGSLPLYVVLGLTYFMCLLLPKVHQTKASISMFLVPVAITAASLLLVYLPIPGNPLHQLEANFPKEIQLPLDISWKVTASAFRDAPFLGTGPSSYLFNFTAYKPVEFNALKFWNFSFDTAYNEFLQVLGTLGLLGLVGITFISIVVINYGRRNIFGKGNTGEEGSQDLAPALAVAAIVAVILLLVHATTIVSMVVTLLIFAALMMTQSAVRDHVTAVSFGIHAATGDNKKFNVFPVIVFALYLVGAGQVAFRTYKVVAADYYHRMALSQASKSGTQTYQYLQKAENLNPQIDLYRVDLAQTNFALANAIAAQKGTSASGNTSALSDADKQTIQTLLSQSINEGRAAVALSPRSSRNWEVLGSIYRNITGVAKNGLTFSLDAYGRAIQRDPLNPLLRVSVGGIYYSNKNYDLAARFFNDAISIKSDYANAYYNLALALRDGGDLTNAKAAAQQTVGLMQQDQNSSDYKTANTLLTDLTVALAKVSKETPAENANGQTSALQNPNLPKINVSDLNNPPAEVATPEAITKKSVAKPSVTPTP